MNIVVHFTKDRVPEFICNNEDMRNLEEKDLQIILNFIKKEIEDSQNLHMLRNIWLRGVINRANFDSYINPEFGLKQDISIIDKSTPHRYKKMIKEVYPVFYEKNFEFIGGNNMGKVDELISELKSMVLEYALTLNDSKISNTKLFNDEVISTDVLIKI